MLSLPHRGGEGVRESGNDATSLDTERERIEPNVWSGETFAPIDVTMPLLMEPEVTRKGIGVGHGLGGVELMEDLVLMSRVCGHWGGLRPTTSRPSRSGRPKHRPQPESDFPMALEPVTGLRG